MDNWLDRQLDIAAASTDKWPKWMQQECGIWQEQTAESARTAEEILQAGRGAVDALPDLLPRP